MEIVARTAHRHPLGFDQLVICDGCRSRLRVEFTDLHLEALDVPEGSAGWGGYAVFYLCPVCFSQGIVEGAPLVYEDLMVRGSVEVPSGRAALAAARLSQAQLLTAARQSG